MILSAAPAPLSKNKNCSPLVLVWNSIGRAGIVAVFVGRGGRLLSWCTERILRWRFSTAGKLIAGPSDIPPSSSAKICCFLITVSVARRFIPALTFATLQLVLLGGCVCWFIYSSKSSFGSSFTLDLLFSFFLKTHSQEVQSFAMFFWSICKHPSLISFRCPRSVAVHSILNAVLFELNEINTVLFKLYEMFVSLNLTYAIPFFMYLSMIPFILQLF